LTGRIDEVAVFNVALEQGDIASLMEEGLETLLAVEARGRLTASWASLKAGS